VTRRRAEAIVRRCPFPRCRRSLRRRTWRPPSALPAPHGWTRCAHACQGCCARTRWSSPSKYRSIASQ